MIRSLAVVGFIFCLLVALQSYTDYWVMLKVACPLETTETAGSCDKQSTPCSAQPEAEIPASCCGSSNDPADLPDATGCPAVADAVCLELPCPDPDQRAECCVLVHPFWIEPPLKLTFQPPNPSALMPEPGRLIEVASPTIIPEKHIPPWGVHPVISTTVLRI